MQRRALCARCLRPQRTCICHWITPLDPAVEVVILQHPMEVANAKGSARLLHLSLGNSRLVEGERFSESELQELMHAPGDRYPILLYPEDPRPPSVGLAPADRPPLHDPARMRLIVLDATWRKSRKMLHLNPMLRMLPRLSLRDMPASAYRIRKAHRPEQLSTLEATCRALMQLEGACERYRPLLEAFSGFVAQQAGHVPVTRPSFPSP